MNIEESDNCIADYVEIHKSFITSQDSNTLLNRVCLSNATTTTFSSTNVMTVLFVTDSYRNKTGFSAMVLTGTYNHYHTSNNEYLFYYFYFIKPDYKVTNSFLHSANTI